MVPFDIRKEMLNMLNRQDFIDTEDSALTTMYCQCSYSSESVDTVNSVHGTTKSRLHSIYTIKICIRHTNILEFYCIYSNEKMQLNSLYLKYCYMLFIQYSL